MSGSERVWPIWRQAKKLGINFSRYCREKQLSFHQWTWIKRALLRKGVIGGRRGAGETEAGGVCAGARCAAARASDDGVPDSPSLGLDDRVRELIRKSPGCWR